MTKHKDEPTPIFSQPPYWAEGLSAIEREIALSNPGWTWTQGGCFAFAEAFHLVYGGKLCGVCTYDDAAGDYPVGHALVEINGTFYDARGAVDPAVCIAQVAKTMKEQAEIRYKDDDDVFWFMDDFLNDEQMATLRHVLAAGAPVAKTRIKSRQKP